MSVSRSEFRVQKTFLCLFPLINYPTVSFLSTLLFRLLHLPSISDHVCVPPAYCKNIRRGQLYVQRGRLSLSVWTAALAHERRSFRIRWKFIRPGNDVARATEATPLHSSLLHGARRGGERIEYGLPRIYLSQPYLSPENQQNSRP